MAAVLTTMNIGEQNSLVDSFLDIAIGQTPNSAKQFLSTCNWQLEEALQLFFAGNEDPFPSRARREVAVADTDVRPPLPARREALYHHQESDYHTAVVRSRLDDALLYHAPKDLLFHGSTFFMAMEEAVKLGKWLLLNVVDSDDFKSHELNRDTWSDPTLGEIIKAHFLFWQVYAEEEQGKKVCTYYHISSFPAILVIDPVTGEKKWARFRGNMEAMVLLSDLIAYTESSPMEGYKFLSSTCDSSSKSAAENKLDFVSSDQEPHEKEEMGQSEFLTSEYDDHLSDGSSETTEIKLYPELTEEPDQQEGMICRVWIRLPDGKRVQRRFNKSDSINFLWSFGCTFLDEEQSKKPFKFIEAIPGATKSYEFDESKQLQTFDEANINNTLLSLIIIK